MPEENQDEARTQPLRWPLRFKAVQVPSDAPWSQDKLDRQRYGELLTRLVERTETPFVLALDSAWGTGKTTFVRMWRQALENQGFKTLYFNAWETDYVAEPLVALVGEMGVLGGSGVGDRFDKVKDLAGKVLRKGIPILARLATGGLLDVKDKEMEQVVGEFVEGVVEERIEQYEGQKEELVAFRAALEDLVHEVAEDGPLVFFVDELDRCRPSFAVELLERIKHLFEVPGIFFVLSTDRDQLAHSVCAVYGEEFDGEEYLRRFVDLTYVLPEPPRQAFASYLLEEAGIKSRMDQGSMNTLAFLFRHLTFNLRQQERVVTLLAIALRCVGGRDARHPILPALIVLRIWRPMLFREFLLGFRTGAGVLEILEEQDSGSWRERFNSASAWIEASFLAYDLSRIDQRSVPGGGERSVDRIKSHQEASEHAENSGTEDPSGDWCAEVVEAYRVLTGGFYRHHRAWQLFMDAVDLNRGFVVDE